MGKRQTEKCPYPSKYAPDTYVTPAQYLNELVCEKKAAYDKTTLPIRFWNLPEWKLYFMKNLRQINKMLEFFDVQVIANALKSPSFFNRYSIFSEHFGKILQVEQIRYDNLQAKKTDQQTEINRGTIHSRPRERMQKPNLFDKLDEL